VLGVSPLIDAEYWVSEEIGDPDVTEMTWAVHVPDVNTVAE
jgi:hypothetical protein